MMSRFLRHQLSIAVLVLSMAGFVQSSHAQSDERFGDWFYGCAENIGCQVTQAIIQNETKQQIGSISVIRKEGNLFDILISAPLGILIPPGFLLSIDNQEVLKLPILLCNLQGCQSRTALTEAAIDALRKGDELRLNYANRDRSQSYIPFSLTGFSRAYSKLIKQ